MKAKIQSLPSIASRTRSRTGCHKITDLGETSKTSSSTNRNIFNQQSTIQKRQQHTRASPRKMDSMQSFQKELIQRTERLRKHTNVARDSFNQLHAIADTRTITDKYQERQIRIQCQKAIEAYESGWDRYQEYNIKKMNRLKKQQRALELHLEPITHKFGKVHE